MNETLLALLGFATILGIIVLLLRNVTVPSLAFIGVSTITSAILVLSGTFTLKEMGDFVKAGVADVHEVDPLDHPPFFHVQARHDPDLVHGLSPCSDVRPISCAARKMQLGNRRSSRSKSLWSYYGRRACLLSRSLSHCI